MADLRHLLELFAPGPEVVVLNRPEMSRDVAKNVKSNRGQMI